MQPKIDEEGSVRVTGYGAGRAEISGLTEKEIDEIVSAIAGGAWVRAVGGRLVSSPAWKDLPEPTTDEEMMPFWRPPTGSEKAHSVQLIDLEVGEICAGCSPHFSIQSLCGYHYSPDFYRTNARKLNSYGFQCLRSRRGPDGKFWEIWYLPGLWCAEGELKQLLEDNKGANEEERTKLTIDFLCRNVSFGTLDVSVQRACMVMD